MTDMDKDVLGKECPKELAELSLDDFVVWVDPLDGTKEFTQGTYFFYRQIDFRYEPWSCLVMWAHN